jgi:hypothetical protein
MVHCVINDARGRVRFMPAHAVVLVARLHVDLQRVDSALCPATV